MAAPDLSEVWDQFAASYTGDLQRDLAERNVPPDLAMEISQIAVAWLASLEPGLVGPGTMVQMPAAAAGALFNTGMMVGIDWARALRHG